MAQQLPNIYLALWNLNIKDPLRIGDVRDRLEANGLSRDHAQDVAPSTAIRRAAETFRGKETEAKAWTCKQSGRTRVQIDAVYEEDGKLHRKFLSQYELGEDDVPAHVSGAVLEDFLTAFDLASSHYTGADVSKVIQSILATDGLGTYSPRKGGAVYFVPVREEAADLLTRIERFCESVSVNFLRYDVPDTNVQREEIASAIAQSYFAEISQHAEYVAGYTLETKPGVVENRREAIQATSNTMARLQGLMNGRYGDLAGEIVTLLDKLRQLDADREAATERARQEAEAIRQQQRQAGGRRIVPISAA